MRYTCSINEVIRGGLPGQSSFLQHQGLCLPRSFPRSGSWAVMQRFIFSSLCASLVLCCHPSLLAAHIMLLFLLFFVMDSCKSRCKTCFECSKSPPRFGFFMTFLGVNDVGAAWHSLSRTGLVGAWARYMEVRWMMEALFEAPLGICLQYYIFLRSMTLKRAGFAMDPLHLHFATAFSYLVAIFQMTMTLYKIADHARALNTNYESYLPALLRHDSDEVFERFLNE